MIPLLELEAIQREVTLKLKAREPMASVSKSDPVRRLQDEFICSICQDYFKDPVVLNCGHTFSRACIARHWEECKENATCPLCRAVFVETELIPNTQLGKTAEKAKLLHSASTNGEVEDREYEKHQQTVTSCSGEFCFLTKVVCSACQDHSSHPQKCMVVNSTENRCEEDELNQEKNRNVHQNGKHEKDKWSQSKGLSGFKKQITKAGFCCVFTAVTSILTVLIIIITALAIVLAVERCNRDLADRELLSQTTSCPEDWIGFRGKCYYFSETEGDGNFSKSNCSSFRASLATIDTREDLAFLNRYKGLHEHWIGLWRDWEEQPWKWPDGTAFNNLFEVKGRGTCAYLTDDDVRSTRCHLEKKWICSKPT